MAFRLEIKNTAQENRDQNFLRKIQGEGFSVTSVSVNDVYTIEKSFSDEDKKFLGKMLTNEVFEEYKINDHFAPESFDYAIEIGYLPGVTDNLASTVIETIEDGLKTKFETGEGVFSSFVFYVSGNISEVKARKIGELFANPLIQRIEIKKFLGFSGMDIVVPQVNIHHTPETLEVDLLNMSDAEMEELGKKGIKDKDGKFRGPLALSLTYLKKIQEYFKSEGRNPRDIELEAIAQTWSEHCRHTIFANAIDDIDDGIFKHFIRRATVDIRKEKGDGDFCVSVFSDNAGGIVFDENWVVSDKMETHNSPSALDPLGGAMTGIVGVNRDALGYGKGSRPVINRYGFCTGDPDKKTELYRGKHKTNQALQPKTILEGVVEGVEHGGNQSGIPTPQGFVYCDERYEGKPLVFAGTVGLIPREIQGKNSSEKQAKVGDHIIMAGGRIGVDGIHGATFSSEGMDEESPATAVQIGDPITQKKMIDAIVYELRDEGFINSVHDCGAGGISGTVGELGMEAGGFEVDLESAPLKYPNMSPWEIWISESQERMCFSVPAGKSQEFCERLAKRGVEATVLGTFTDTGRGVIRYKGDVIYDLDLEFLETGWPKERQVTKPPSPLVRGNEQENFSEKFISSPDKGIEGLFVDLLSRKNIASYEFISGQYDHIVQGGAVIGPMQGVGKVNGTAAVTRPVLDSQKAVVTSQALNPKWSEIDPYQMALASIDDAVAAAVAVGGDVDYMAIMDNFCWCSSDEGERLWQLKEAARGCYDAAVAYSTPFISGKDSMFNDFKGYDKDNNEIKISVPPTLLVSAMSVIPDSTKTQTIDFKFAGDSVYVIGEISGKINGSEYAFMNHVGGELPSVDLETAKKRYQRIFEGHQLDLFASIQHIGLGGLAAAVSKSAIAGNMGVQISQKFSLDQWVAEEKSRFLVSVAPDKLDEFETLFPDAKMIGKVTNDKKISGIFGGIDLSKLAKAYKSAFSVME